FQWSGEQGWSRALPANLITFGVLRGSGHVLRDQNFVVQQLVSSGSLVAANQMTAAVGITARPEGSYSDQFFHALTTNLQLHLGGGLVRQMAPGLAQVERSLALDIQSRSILSESIRNIEVRNLIRSSEPSSRVSENPLEAMGLLSVNPLFLIYPGKALLGAGLGFLASFLQRRPAIASLVSLVGGMAAYRILGHADLSSSIGDLILLSSAVGTQQMLSRRWARQARENPFLPSEADFRIPEPVERPENIVAMDPVDLKQTGTLHHIEGDRGITSDGFPENFRWEKEVQAQIPNSWRRFHNTFDAVAVSMLFGALTRSSFSRRFVEGFARSKGIDLSRFVSRKLNSTYTSFNDFFTRRLKAPRFYEGAAPCEGEIVYIARGSVDQVLTLKGQRISLRALVGETLAQRLPERVGVVVTYLSPRDLHIEGAPVAGVVTHIESIPGYAHTVDPRIWNEVDYKGQHGAQYLVFNKRDIIAQEFSMPRPGSKRPVRMITAYIAAANVYSAVIHPELGQEVKAGEHRQTYNMGSTNVYIFDANHFDFAHDLYPGQKMVFGETPFIIPKRNFLRREPHE
ncbi:MAG: phosphatidylserine decarboxylase, partial [Deltaproteobacteria bacterium]|nr:phosphatidylserine decarboxylase [Deltaproteobacteria bacterium]